MLTRPVNSDQAVHILEMDGVERLQGIVRAGEFRATGNGENLVLKDLLTIRLAQIFSHMGVPVPKAFAYAEAVLDSRLPQDHESLLEWIENENQELFCSIADDQLTRIFLRSHDGQKEVDVGAVRPELFPTTRCEVNVFRAIRPVVFKARKILDAKAFTGT